MCRKQSLFGCIYESTHLHFESMCTYLTLAPDHVRELAHRCYIELHCTTTNSEGESIDG